MRRMKTAQSKDKSFFADASPFKALEKSIRDNTYGGTTARRKNASFTGSPLAGRGTRELVEAFYRVINYKIPGSTPVPIPPPASVHPKHGEEKQAYIFADYAFRKFFPIALDAAGLKAEASKLRKLKKIVNQATTETAGDVVNHHAIRNTNYNTANAARAARAAYDAAYDAASAAAYDAAYDAAYRAAAAAAAGYGAAAAAELNPEATWAAVNEMLNEL
jgi:hypothetical protein